MRGYKGYIPSYTPSACGWELHYTLCQMLKFGQSIFANCEVQRFAPGLLPPRLLPSEYPNFIDGLYFSTQVNGAVCLCRKRLAELRRKIYTFGDDKKPWLEFRGYLYRLCEEMQNRLDGVSRDIRPRGINEQNGSKHSIPQ